jgi:phosphohistidine swiveling domain-containing protein
MIEDRWITDYTPSPRWPHYTRANAGEVLPTPASPLGQTFAWDNGIIHGAAHGSTRTGLYEAHEYDPVIPETFGFFGGFLYINLANIRMQGVRNPAVTVDQLDLAFFGDHPDVPPYVAHPHDDKPHLVGQIEAHTEWALSTTEWPELHADRATVDELRNQRPDLRALTDADLLARARVTQPLLVQGFSQHYLSSSSSGIAPGILGVVGEAIDDPDIPMRLLAGLGDVDSAAPSHALWEMSRLIQASPALTNEFEAGVDGLLPRLRNLPEAADLMAEWDSFVHEFGSRGPNEWELSAPTWETKPQLALAALDRVRLQDNGQAPQLRAGGLADARTSLAAEVRAKLQEIGDEELSAMFEAALIGGNMMVFRERTKTTIIKAVHEARMVFLELGRRHTEAGTLADVEHIWMLTNDELDDFVAEPGAFTETLASRYDTWSELWELEPPFIIRDGIVPPLTQWARKGADAAAVAQVGETLAGIAGSPGIVRGTACIVLDPGDPGELGPGDIMVAPLTDPAWTPLFMAVDGVVVNVGGQISHAIIVSRELGLPCVVSVERATERIPDGALIEVNGTTGQVTIIE